MESMASHTHESVWQGSQLNSHHQDPTINWQYTDFPVDSADYSVPEITYSGPHDARSFPETTNSQPTHNYVDEDMLSNYTRLNNTSLQTFEDYGVFSSPGSSEWTSSECPEPWEAQPAYGPSTPLLSSGELVSPAIRVYSKRKLHKCRHCSASFPRGNLTSHIQTAHPELLECQQCHAIFAVTDHLDRHGRERKHEAFKCNDCIVSFTRLGDLRRHNQKHQPDAQQSVCPHCPRVFLRKDHLTQHLRSFHRIGTSLGPNKTGHACLLSSCKDFRNTEEVESETMPFLSSKHFRAHMRRVHDFSPFPCSELGCGKVGAEGYFREADLRKHWRKEHLQEEQPRTPCW